MRGKNKIGSFKSYGDASGIYSHYRSLCVQKTISSGYVIPMTWELYHRTLKIKTAIMIEYCAKMMRLIGVEETRGKEWN